MGGAGGQGIIAHFGLDCTCFGHYCTWERGRGEGHVLGVGAGCKVTGGMREVKYFFFFDRREPAAGERSGA